ncbi:transcriptional regulator with XRE-family HTH domain [Paenibacillus castaneae]|uniref:helix-turn-helix domain-containing protein n=2 Tax=Paenibacillus TaxID=44249 RepID=UPI000C99AAD5|nr:helix-turn-helix transcriptional regulator [Paenibacillus castaneae]NIK77952.1 transcriptional regulator with XRE-family HTH domain [Paenibacillus castaneae]
MNDKKSLNKRKKDIVIGRVKELRELKNLTQHEFAESIDVSSNTISRIERGEMSLSSDLALKIADTYGISLDWLFYRGDDQLSPKLRANFEEAFKCMQESTSIPISLKINKKTPSD